MGANSIIEAVREFPIPLAAAYSFVALIGYVFGLINRNRSTDAPTTRREVKRARTVVSQFEALNVDLKRELADHRAATSQFKDRLSSMAAMSDTAACQELSFAAEFMLKPTQKLATSLANAHDEIRQQASFLMMFTEVRTDPLTGLSNRRALEEMMTSLLAMWSRYQAKFSIAVFDIDHFKSINDQQGHLQGDRILIEVARMIERHIRDTDLAVRYGGEEFVVIMPETDLEGAAMFADRIRQHVAEDVECTISGGVTQALEHDDSHTLFERADDALYQAKEAGRNRVFQADAERSVLVVDPEITTSDAGQQTRGKSETAASV